MSEVDGGHRQSRRGAFVLHNKLKNTTTSQVDSCGGDGVVSDQLSSAQTDRKRDHRMEKGVSDEHAYCYIVGHESLNDQQQQQPGHCELPAFKMLLLISHHLKPFPGI